MDVQMATLGPIIELGHHEELAHDGLQTLCGVRAGWEGGFRLIDESANQQLEHLQVTYPS